MDTAIALWISAFERIEWLDRILIFITNLDEKGFIWLLLSFILLVRPKTRRAGVLCFLALALYSLIGSGIIKPLVARARPFEALDLVPLLPHPGGYSFPSGHAGSSFATATAFWFSYRGWPGKLALCLALMIALTRVLLLAHYLTDILAGALLGIACALFVRWLVGKLWKAEPIEQANEKS